MPSLIPHRFLFRMMHPCRLFPGMPSADSEHLIDLPERARIDLFAEPDEPKPFADFRIGWNAGGLGIQVEVRGRTTPLMCDPERPRQSDGFTLWIDTRGDRSSHRALRTCQQFHFLPTGGGPDRDTPLVIPEAIHRALHDSPLPAASDIPLNAILKKDSWRMEIFLNSGVLNGFDPEQHPRLGLFYSIRDTERGEQTAGLSSEFPFHEDPSLWATLELMPPESAPQNRSSRPS
jgi:hypothetical protein